MTAKITYNSVLYSNSRYVYAAVIGVKAVIGVVKLDLSLTTKDGSDFTVASSLYGPGCSGGEPLFVPKEPSNPAAEEDDGYLLAFVYDENTDESKFAVMDAKSPSLDIIAAVKLPRRVPNGFHIGLFVSESELEKL
ncbi:Zeaxanthin 7,8-dioxygenase [Handroanthus impetiginosus]|uniref:Zeaxanthin 7,8-dioxygenase n=1 Tax=Handroanthus impetiginosus TaxID=429701 RepID=A0A2G9GNC9_9LAMI|nr:Zeaxanthin 7,8-dioxygenase [Handroanthus impetiginosus]